MLYRQTLQACALEADLEILPGGDLTEIGEKVSCIPIYMYMYIGSSAPLCQVHCYLNTTSFFNILLIIIKKLGKVINIAFSK